MNKYIKLVLAALLTVGAFYAFYENENGLGIFLLLLVIVPVFFFFRNEYTLLAFWQMRKQDIEGTKKWLSKIKNPEKQLFKQQYGYYHYLCGLAESQDNINTAEQHMKKALKHGLSFAHDRAIANLNLAAAAMAKGKKREAEQLLIVSQKEDKQNMLESQIKMMKEQMKKVNTGKHMHNPHMRNRGRYF